VWLSRAVSTRVSVDNPHPPGDVDAFFHLGITSQDDLAQRFGDVKFFCTGGSAARIRLFAQKVARELADVPGVETPPFGSAPEPIGKTDRYTIFKVGPVLIANHHMGMPTTSILLHEITKLLSHAGARDPLYIRMGTSGGIGVEPGTVVVATEAMNGLLKPEYTLSILGEPVSRPSVYNPDIVQEIIASATEVPIIAGRTMGTDCFYEGQARLDGAICEYSEAQKMAFLEKAHDVGVRNIEMEAPLFGAFTHRLGIRAACVCVTLINRLKGDQPQRHLSDKDLAAIEERPGDIVMNYIKGKLLAEAGAGH